jgi:hypothetical protein
VRAAGVSLAAQAEGGIDAANLLKPALARGGLRCIGATTLAEYRKHIEKDPALGARCFISLFYSLYSSSFSQARARSPSRALAPSLARTLPRACALSPSRARLRSRARSIRSPPSLMHARTPRLDPATARAPAPLAARF